MFKGAWAAVLLASFFCCCFLIPLTVARGASESQKPQFNTKEERIGPLRLEMAEKDLSSALSCKPVKSAEILEGATGEYVQTWKYPACGVILGMNSESRGGPKTVEKITVASPSKLETSRGIHIGSAESQVAKAYGRYRDTEVSVAGRTFVAGSPYDGMIFTFKNGKVVEIFLGAAAE